MPDPFDVLGVAARFDLEAKALEKAHLQVIRGAHPDHLGDRGAAEQAAALSRAADANDAYRTLKAPWDRAKALAERMEPGVLKRHEKPDPAFLMEVMELREEVESAIGEAEEAARQKLQSQLRQLLDQIAEAFRSSYVESAAKTIHRGGYFRQALARLDG